MRLTDRTPPGFRRIIFPNNCQSCSHLDVDMCTKHSVDFADYDNLYLGMAGDQLWYVCDDWTDDYHWSNKEIDGSEES